MCANPGMSANPGMGAVLGMRELPVVVGILGDGVKWNLSPTDPEK
jgi:hypothetical protein